MEKIFYFHLENYKLIITVENSNKNYFFHSNKDLLEINNSLQYTILIGNIDKEKYLYNIEFILDFNSLNDCENQKKK